MDEFSASAKGSISVEVVGRSRYVWRGLGQVAEQECQAVCQRDKQAPQIVTFIAESLLGEVDAALIDMITSVDGVRSVDYRLSLLFAFCRDVGRILPDRPLGLYLPPVPLMIAALLRKYACELGRLNLDAPEPDLAAYWLRAAALVRDDYRAFTGGIHSEVQHVARMYLALEPVSAIMKKMAVSEIEFGTLYTQDLLMSAIETEYAPPSTHADDFIVAYGRLVESRLMELHEAIINRQMEILKRRATVSFSLFNSCHDPPSAGYQTLYYEDNEERPERRLDRITFRTSASMISNCGLTAWPAGFLLADFCLEHRPLGLRVLELGSGATGLVPVICARAGAAAVFATDFADAVLDVLSDNVGINAPDDRILVRKLDWLVPDDAVLNEARPDLVLLADTIYCPDLIRPQVNVIQRAFAFGAKRALLANCRRQEATFSLLEATLMEAGLQYEHIPLDIVPARFQHVHRPDNLVMLAVTPAPTSL